MKNASEQAKVNIGSTYEKCPEMTQLMLREGELHQSYGAENGSFPEIDGFHDFQDPDSEGFSSLFETKRHVKQRKGPAYRKINTYYKSTEQYWKERNRRKKAWELCGKYTYKQIAEKLGVSEKTVQRDMKKIRPYYARLTKAYFRKLDEERRMMLRQKLEGATIRQRLDILMAEWKTHEQLLKQREYNRHMIKIIIDLDDLTYGFPAIRVWPNLPITLRDMPYYFQLHFKRNDENYYVGEIKLG